MGICTYLQICEALETNPLTLLPKECIPDKAAKMMRLFGQLTEAQQDAMLRMTETMLPAGTEKPDNGFDGTR